MLIYKHTQKSFLLGTFLLFITISGCLTYLQQKQPASNQISLLIGITILTACTVTFYSLTVTINGNTLKLYYGIGLIQKSFDTSQIIDLNIVKNKWYYGWGIRRTPHGWLYNISGLDAVELTLKNGNSYRIGTDQPKQLLEGLQKSRETTN